MSVTIPAMADSADPYEAPAVETRTAIGPMLIGVVISSGNIDNALP
jgi:hypothetical protein